MESVPGMLRRREMVGRSVAALVRAHEAGVESIIDCTPWDLGRQVWLFEAVAERSPVNIVCATGVYRWVPPIYWGMSPDEIAEIWTREIEEGITVAASGRASSSWHGTSRRPKSMARAKPPARISS